MPGKITNAVAFAIVSPRGFEVGKGARRQMEMASFGRKGPCDCEADPFRSTGDQDRFATKIELHDLTVPARFLAIGICFLA